MIKTFELNPTFTKPYALMDLDDTLFQTLRKIETWQLPTDDLTVATVNKQGEPLSFFTPKQSQFFNWLSHTTELIPVTARDTVEIRRVKLPFTSWQILTHGAVILDKNGEKLAKWDDYIYQQLKPQQTNLLQLIERFEQINIEGDPLGNLQTLTITPHYDEFNGERLMIYLAVKHKQKHGGMLATIGSLLEFEVAENFYIHTNSNNLAVLPHGIHKKWAVEFLLTHYLDKNKPTFGFGDSIADLPFLQRLDWYGTPSRGQLHEYIGE